MVRVSQSYESNLDQIEPYEFISSERLTHPLMLASPHSGRNYPTCFLSQSRLNQTTLRRSEDFCIDDLYSFAGDLNTPIVSAQFPRSFVDVNRSCAEIDPSLLFPDEAPRVAALSKRVANGLGVIPRVVGAGIEIYTNPIGMAEINDRLERFHTPYHARLGEQLQRIKDQFGAAVLFDCHSMPDTVSTRRLTGSKACDIVLGDRFGASCNKQVVDAAEETLAGLGYKVVRNDPYAGGYTTTRYGRPSHGFHALQIEINRRIYMDERRLRLSRGYEKLKRNLQVFIEEMITVCATLDQTDQRPIAAE